MREEYTLRLRQKDNTVSVQGVGWGYQRPILKEETATHLFVRVPGGQSWISIGTVDYRGPSALVFRKLEEWASTDWDTAVRCFRVIQIFSQDYDRASRTETWQRAREVAETSKEQ